MASEQAGAAQVLVASNRGPVTYSLGADGTLDAKRGGGGLVSGLSAVGDEADALWVCAALGEGDREAVRRGVGEPGVPPIAETVPGYEASIYNGVVAPAAGDSWSHSFKTPAFKFLGVSWAAKRLLGDASTAAGQEPSSDTIRLERVKGRWKVSALGEGGQKDVVRLVPVRLLRVAGEQPVAGDGVNHVRPRDALGHALQRCVQRLLDPVLARGDDERTTASTLDGRVAILTALPVSRNAG